MSTVNQDELKAIKVLNFEGKESEWERWSETFVALARARGFAGILLGTEQAPNADEDIDRKKDDGSYELTDAERKETKRKDSGKQMAMHTSTCSSHVKSYLMTWSPRQKLKNSQMDAQEMQGRD